MSQLSMQMALDDARRRLADRSKLASDCKVGDRQDGQPAHRPSEGAAVKLSGSKLVECGSLRWYVARTRQWHDQKAAKALRREGFAAHAFRVEQEARRQHSVLRPLFPGFLFVQAVAARGQIGRILRLDGPDGYPLITGVLASVDGVPLPVPERQMRLFLDHADAKDIWTDPAEPPAKPDEVGEVFRVAVGPMTSFEGMCVRDERGEIDLELSIFGRTTTVTLRRDQADRLS